MANARVGSQASWSQNCVETITEGKTLTPGDSGKVFMVDNTTAHTIFLPKLSSKVAGWNCKMIVQVDGSAVVSVLANGLPVAGGDLATYPNSDAESVIFREFPMADEAGAVTTSQDGFNIAAAAIIGDTFDIFSDGTSWFVTAMIHEIAHSDDIDA